jgi:fluoroacetyl-CoA thioesterase
LENTNTVINTFAKSKIFKLKGHAPSMNIPENAEYEYEVEVKEELTARQIGLDVLVFSTPCLVQAMEIAALRCVEPYLPDTHTTVGTGVCIKHLKATPLGDKVRVKAKLMKVDGPKLEFEVEAWDSQGKVGEGKHYRYIVEKKKFEERVMEMMR